MKVLRNGKSLSVDEHLELAKHLRMIDRHAAAMQRILEGKARVSYIDQLMTARRHTLKTLRCHLEDDFFEAHWPRGTVPPVPEPLNPCPRSSRGQRTPHHD